MSVDGYREQCGGERGGVRRQIERVRGRRMDRELGREEAR